MFYFVRGTMNFLMKRKMGSARVVVIFLVEIKYLDGVYQREKFLAREFNLSRIYFSQREFLVNLRLA